MFDEDQKPGMFGPLARWCFYGLVAAVVVGFFIIDKTVGLPG
jgi:hypothetical protein